MVTTCCVSGCKNRAGKDRASFFRFPQRPESRRRAWIESLERLPRRSNLTNDDDGTSESVPSSKEPSKYDRVCSDHFVTGKPQTDPSHVDYFPTLKMVHTKILSTHGSPGSSSRSRKGARKAEEAQKRQEAVAVAALLTMTNLDRVKATPRHQTKSIQTCTHPGDSFLVAKGKLNHLEKEIELLQRINSDLRLQKERCERQLQQQSTMATEECKKRKHEDGSGDDATVVSSPDNFAFKDFTLKRVLREDHRSKLICMHGSLSIGEHREADAVVLLERKPFDIPSLEKSLHKARTSQILHNDIYSTHDAFSAGLSADMKATVICPATEKHISKYSDHKPFLVRETPELYRTVTEPCMAQSKFSIQWVYNILEKKTESERIVTEDVDPELGFVLLPDMKWDGRDVDQLYLVAICHKRAVRSLRHLGAEHLPLLENIRDKGMAAIKEKYGVPAHQLRVYLHYRPSYEHLHVHFTSLRLEAPPGSDILRAHLLDDVINNIRACPDYYQSKTISYVVRDGDELYQWYKDAGYFAEDDLSVDGSTAKKV